MTSSINQPRKDGNCRGDPLLVLSLLQCPPLSEEEVNGYSSSNIAPELTFEDPFSDSSLEPLPLRAEYSDAPRIDQKAGLSDECISLFDRPSTIDLEKALTFVVDPIGRFQDKRSFPAAFPHPSFSSTDVGAETSARFRPYQDKKWKGSFQRLIKFKTEFGHCCVPHSYGEDPALARWVKRQRHQYKKFMDNDPTSTLTTSRLEQLQAVGFVWHSHAAAWLEKLNELKDFKDSLGHCNVPSSFPKNPALSTWVKCQRRQYKLRISGQQSTLTKDRFEILQAMGFVFEPRRTNTA